jgi:hypothetical protein
MLAFQHQLPVVEQRYDDYRPGMGYILAHSHLAIRHAGLILMDMQKLAVENITAADLCFREILVFSGHGRE